MLIIIPRALIPYIILYSTGSGYNYDIYINPQDRGCQKVGGIKSPRGNAVLQHFHLQHYQWLQTDLYLGLVRYCAKSCPPFQNK